MNLSDKVVVVTGAGSGIGREICIGRAEAGSRVVVSDIDLAAASEVASRIGGLAVLCDVSNPSQLANLIDTAETELGPIDIFVSNAGILNGLDLQFDNAAAPQDDVWTKAWDINVMSHVRASRILVPKMKQRGGGYFVNTISAAGILSQIGSAVYSTTKHAALGFAENLAITHRKDGIRVSALCPQYVETAIDGIREERFLILPHPQVAEFYRLRAESTEHWIAGMSRLQAKIEN